MAARMYVGQSGTIYEPVEPVGPGGFGSVERVRAEDSHEFALKTLHLGFDPAVLNDEAANLQRVQHQNVVAYVDHGSDPEPFLVMELASGGTLKDQIGRAQQGGEHVTADVLVETARELLAGLAAIHEVLLHRDLKPANVMVDQGVLKIGDFGMTRLVEASTRTETLKGGGTPLYMPPEGWAGLSGPTPTAAYDLYSLGVILYELATLQAPFTGSRDELRHAHLFSEPRRPSELRPDLPPPFERLVLQLLRKDPAQRGASAAACLELVEQMGERSDSSVAASPVLDRLQQGAAALMQRAAEQEAEMIQVREALSSRRELLAHATERLSELIDEAVGVVSQNVAPLEVTGRGLNGKWNFGLQHSTRRLDIEFGAAPGRELLRGAPTPGDLLGFGHIAISEGDARRGATLGGANIVAYTTEAAPWVVNYQEIQLRNMALMSQPMRNYEPFYLQNGELADHMQYLWGGGMHVYTGEHRELTTDVFVEWFGHLVP
jgi:hypothetical protein